jgi:alpha-glucosidase
MAPVFLYYPEAPFFICKDQYMLGPDLLVAPVMKEGALSRNVVLPDEKWRHLFYPEEYGSGIFDIAAPLGFPPVFYRHDSKYAALFAGISAQFGKSG